MSPNSLLLDYLLPPTSLVLLLLLAALVWRWRSLSRGLFAIGTLGLLLASLPIVGSSLLKPLAAGAPAYRPEAHGRRRLADPPHTPDPAHRRVGRDAHSHG